MLSVASLLNPVVSEPRGTRLPSSPPSSFTTSSSHASPMLATSSIKKHKMTKDGAIFAKGKIKGEVNFPPFEHFDEETMREVKKFQVYPLGKIQDYGRHIPYNSEKKSFLEKTGRESFEVFQYIFRVPGDEKDYTVMWDYNIGLVRITPFFKCCKYSKTTPAKMLNMNPGLKEITHSITGGALAAQGYWMPYSCALAVCTTFCSHIAGALIPIFGPSFPAQCVPPEAPEHGRMIIEPSVIVSATAEAEAFRRQYSTYTPRSSPRTSYSPSGSSPHPSRLHLVRNRNITPGRSLRLKGGFGDNTHSVYDTDIETNGSESSSGDAYFCDPLTPPPGIGGGPGLAQAWNARNLMAHSANGSINISPGHIAGPSPWLSAIPRSSGMPDVQMGMGGALTGSLASAALVGSSWRNKRRVEEVDVSDDGDGEKSGYEGEESGESVGGRDDKSVAEGKSDGDADADGEDVMMGGVEKKAAWLLMKLSVKDGEAVSTCCRGGIDGKDEGDSPRVKRAKRATSL